MTTQPETIVVLTMGGTIDKVYFDALSEFQVGEPAVTRLLHLGGVACPFRVIELTRKDSLEITDQERAHLREQVAALQERRIVVTHGTDTMTDSAKALADVRGKTIVFTGALAPARFQESDASFNLGMAFAAAQTLPPGVYIAMSGQIFPGDRVRKDRRNARFEAI
ncbi:MAG TPA: asparaginase domain-containing protein [Steroidobacter sp.]|jgi:L-asparaginase|nr:asparaginase domain-containing protein [Steroidobacter sp.]